MTFSIQKERIHAISPEGVPMGYIAFPRIRAGLVNINDIIIASDFRQLGVGDDMMEALLLHLEGLGVKAILTCPFAQQYLEKNPRWKKILPGDIHFTKY